MNITKKTIGAIAVLGLLGIPALALANNPNIFCRTWQDGEWGKAECRNEGSSSGRARIVITCADWWDPDVVSDWVSIAPNTSARLSGHCWGGGVKSISVETE